LAQSEAAVHTWSLSVAEQLSAVSVGQFEPQAEVSDEIVQ
jgi:hypothetical protein